MLRVAYLCRSLPFHRQGGMEGHAWDLAKGLARRGHRLRIITTPFERPGRDTPLGRDLAAVMAGAKAEALVGPNARGAAGAIEFHEVGDRKSGRYSLAYLAEAARLAAEWARRGEIDLLHCQGFAGLLIHPAALGGVPFLTTIHGTWWSETLLDFRARRRLPGWRQIVLLWKHRQRVALRPLFDRMLRRTRLLLVDSKFTRNELVRDHPELAGRIRLAPLGVDLGRFPPAGEKGHGPGTGGGGQEPTRPGTSPVRLLALGRLEASKGFDVALRALAECRNRNWILRIGGDGPDQERLERLARDLGLMAAGPHPTAGDEVAGAGRKAETDKAGTDKAGASGEAHRIGGRVRFLGRVPDDRLAREFAEADLFLNPDLTQPAFGLVALEAMLQATPVLASRVGAMPEVLGEAGGWLAEPGDTEAWRRALEPLLDAPDRLSDQGRLARGSALARFSLDRMVEEVEAAYREALKTERMTEPGC